MNSMLNNTFLLRQRRAKDAKRPTVALSDANRKGEARGYNCLPSSGSYTWSNLWLLIDCALGKIDSQQKQHKRKTNYKYNI
jgi:hypothetical protein